MAAWRGSSPAGTLRGRRIEQDCRSLGRRKERETGGEKIKGEYDMWVSLMIVDTEDDILSMTSAEKLKIQ